MKKNRTVIYNVILGIILVGLMIFVCTKKEGFHVDEYATFALSNSLYEEEIGQRATSSVFEDYKEYTGIELYTDWFGVDEETKFNVENVNNRQEVDVHPTLYYLIINFLCSIVDNANYLIWTALGLNIFIGSLIYILLIRLSNLWIKNELHAGLISFAFCSSMAALNGIIYIRMYVLLTFFTIALMYMLIATPPSELTLKSKKFFVGLYFVTLGGILTQYYFVIYLVFATVIYGIFLIANNKKIKELIAGIGVVVLSGLSACIIFPGMLVHFEELTARDQVTESINGENLDNFRLFWNFIDDQLFGGHFIIIALIIVVLILLNKKLYNNCTKIQIEKYIILLFPAVMTLVVVSSVSPFISSRYVYNLMFAFYLSVIVLIYVLINIEKSKVIAIIVCGTLLISITTYLEDGFIYQYSERAESVDLIKETIESEEATAVYVYDYTWKINYIGSHFLIYDSIVLINENQLDQIEEHSLENYKSIVLYVENTLDVEVITEIMAEYFSFDETEVLFEDGYTVISYLN